MIFEIANVMNFKFLILNFFLLQIMDFQMKKHLVTNTMVKMAAGSATMIQI